MSTRTAPADVDALVERATALARRWEAAGDGGAGVSAKERAATARLASLVHDPAGVDFALGFVDKVARPEDDPAAARELRALARGKMPAFLGPLDRALVAAGGIMAPRMPGVVVPASRRRLRQLVGHLVVQVGASGDKVLARRLAAARAEGVQLNLNLLGEAVLGQEEAARRRERTAELLARPDVDYVSVKATSVLAQLAPWDHEASLERLEEALLPLYRIAMGKTSKGQPAHAFINLDMEEYKDLDLTVTLFERLCANAEIAGLEIGIVLQAYLPDALAALERVSAAGRARRAAGGARVKVRLVKGANLAMEAVDAELHHWPQAPYTSKAQVDASYVRLLDRALDPHACEAVRVGVASHNLFHVALAHLLSLERGVSGAVDVEALQGMAPAQTRAIGAEVGAMVLYTPVVHVDDFDVAVSYLVRRLEENASPEGFLYSLFAQGEDPLAGQELAFRASVAGRETVADAPRRTQDVAAAETAAAETVPGDPDDPDEEADDAVVTVSSFVPEPDTDPSLAANRAWARRALAADPGPALTRVVTETAAVDAAVSAAATAGAQWAGTPAVERARALTAVGDALAAHRGALLSVMVHEGGKTVAEADPEISEAIDFARYYATRALALEGVPGAAFTPAGVVAITPPWNFPVAITVGGALAALAAGAAAIVKPAPQVVRCAEVALGVVADALAEAGAPPRLLQVLRTDEEAAGRRLVTHPDVDAVVLTGASDTAALFTSWRPDLRLLAETSGKNSLVITPSADVDLAVADLVRSAFGHAGQKCSAASLGIVVGSVARSPRFRRQLLDAVTSLAVGPGTDLSTTVGPLVEPASGKLLTALTTLEPGESWLVEPRRLDEEGRLWSPGVKEGVRPGSTTHLTEFFGPVLGIMAARDLDEAIAWQNASGYGLTGGLHSLEEAEIDRWLEEVAVGCAYVNRHITGAIVQRQPFGGWGRSVHGPGAKAGGPSYVMQLGTWADTDDAVAAIDAAGAAAEAGAGVGTGALEPRPAARVVLTAAGPHVDEAGAAWLRAAAASDALAWREEFSLEHDPTGLLVESNVLRYRPLPSLSVRAGSDAPASHLARVLLVAAAAGVRVDASVAADRGDLLALATAAGLGDVARPGQGVRTGSVVAEGDAEAARRVAVGSAGWDGGSRLRLLGTSAGLAEAAAEAGVSLLPAVPVAAGRVEGMTVLREQTISRTRHRFGHVEERAPSVR